MAVKEKQAELVLHNFSAKESFKNIRNYLAGRFVGATRDDALLKELIKFIFCRFYIFSKQIPLDEQDELELAKTYRRVFSDIKRDFVDIFELNEEILLDPGSIAFLHNELKDMDLLDLERDPIGDAYEVFTSSSIRGQDGQFFTPNNAIHVLVNAVKPKPGDIILDPACGAGGFLVAVIHFFIKSGYKKEVITEAINSIYGVDKDDYLSFLARTHVASLTTKMPNISCADSIVWDQEFIGLNAENSVDVLITNPPFGANIVSGSEETLKNYDLAYKWKVDKDGKYSKTDKLNKNVPPQVLFVERCIKIVKPGGKIGMVVPESLISSNKYNFVVEYIRNHCDINAVMGMPESLFKTSGKGGTHTKTCLLILTKKNSEAETVSNKIFFAEAKWCGHDSRGKKIPNDDLPLILDNYLRYKEQGEIDSSKNGYIVAREEIKNNILGPRYYDPSIKVQYEQLKATHNLVTVQELLESGVITIKTGDEVGKLAYGTGNIPFVRTSDISNWEVKVDPKQGVSEEIYNSLKGKQDIKDGDILMVKDGTYLIGTCALVTKYDEKIVYQSHLYKIRVHENNYGIDPYLLIAILSSEFVQKQIKAKTSTQDIIDSLGTRIKELTLPISKDKVKIERVSSTVSKAIYDRIEARELSRQAVLDVLL